MIEVEGHGRLAIATIGTPRGQLDGSQTLNSFCLTPSQVVEVVTMKNRVLAAPDVAGLAGHGEEYTTPLLHHVAFRALLGTGAHGGPPAPGRESATA